MYLIRPNIFKAVMRNAKSSHLLLRFTLHCG